jgi:hypothetical protein
MGQEKPTLKMTISRSINLAPLDADVAPGQSFDKEKVNDLITKSNSGNSWYKVPAWYAGKWQSNQTIQLFRRDEASGLEDFESHVQNWHNSNGIGNYADKTGQVWQYDEPGFWSDYDSPFNMEAKHFCRLSGTQKVATESEYAFDTEFLAFSVDKTTKRITRCDRGTTEVSIHPTAPGIVVAHVIQRTFEWQGNPEIATVSEAEYKKTGDLVPDANWKRPDGRPMFPLFVQYLKEHGMADRLPDAPLAAPGAVAKP